MSNLEKVNFSFDIGHSSIGWAAIQPSGECPDILGCGVVTFRPNDCQNHQRAGFRRSRRNIAARRNRIKRLEALLLDQGALSESEFAEARENPHPCPWFLAAKILTGHRYILTWGELWAVVRWYAHNRGYDGNALWSSVEEAEEKEDTKKVENANRLMEVYGTTTMAETICAFLGADPAEASQPVVDAYFKGEDAAFPRPVVQGEAKKILEAHIGKLPGCTADLVETICGDKPDSWKTVNCPAIRLPKRFHGGLLFGQMVPRFENRIIPVCRLSGEKTPAKHCRAFYRYRWGKLLCNLKVEDQFGLSRKLTGSERQKVNEAMEKNGYLTKGRLKAIVEEATGCTAANAEQMFMVPEMERALVLDPVRREVSSQKLSGIWSAIPDRFQKRFAGRLFKGRRSSLDLWKEEMKADGIDLSEFDDALAESFEAFSRRKRKNPITFKEFCAERIKITGISGRAAYSRRLMEEAWEAVFDDGKPDPHDKGGCLEETVEVVSDQLRRSIDDQTNNHLVRHRLLIFQHLLKDLVKDYANGDPDRVGVVALEVVRDLQEFSAKTAKEKAQLIGLKLSDHRKAVELIESELPKYSGRYSISAGLIKKVRIARELDWTCPFTGKHYCFHDVVTGQVDREHIIPRSWRPSDAMDSLVLTWPEVNRMKGQRTALEFMSCHAGEKVPGTELRLQPLANYEKFVDNLKPKSDPRGSARDFIDDDLRKYRRKQLLRILHFDKRKKSDGDGAGGFTGRDLTQTSHLNKLAALQAREILNRPHDDSVWSLAGSVTAAARKAWKLEGCLTKACPLTEGKTKTEIREITHLHHALDAVTIGLAACFFPKNGRLWDLMSRRQITNARDKEEFARLVGIGISISFSEKGQWNVPDLPPVLKERISQKLEERRVVQHQPKTMRGLRVQQNTWRICHEDEDDPDKMVITMASRDEKTRERKRSTKSEKKSKLLGFKPRDGKGKLKLLKGGLIVEDNFGVILDPEPHVLPHKNVFTSLKEAREKNGGVVPRLIRGGSLIRINDGRYKGTWRVFSVKDAKAGLLIDMANPDMVKVANRTPGCVINALLPSLLKGGLEILHFDYCFSLR